MRVQSTHLSTPRIAVLPTEYLGRYLLSHLQKKKKKKKPPKCRRRISIDSDTSRFERMALFSRGMKAGSLYTRSSTNLRNVDHVRYINHPWLPKANNTWIHKVNTSIFSQSETSRLRRWEGKDCVRGLRLVSSSTRIQPFICHVTPEPMQFQAPVRQKATHWSKHPRMKLHNRRKMSERVTLDAFQYI